MKITSKSRGGSTPRKTGDAVERQVAKLTGGSRIPMSGSMKTGNFNLCGDIAVKDSKGREFMKLEVKCTGTLTPSGDATFTLKKKVLDQMVNEARATGETGALYLHWKNKPYTEDFVIMRADDWLRFLDYAKVGAGEYA